MELCLSFSELPRFRAVADEMFRQRAIQFQVRQDWKVNVDSQGHELDEFDRVGSRYILIVEPHDKLIASARVRIWGSGCMTHMVFPQLFKTLIRTDVRLLEVSRLCITPCCASRKSAHLSKLVAATFQILASEGFDGAVGVYDAKMSRLYRTLGWEPSLVGRVCIENDELMLGIWWLSECPEKLRRDSIYLQKDLPHKSQIPSTDGLQIQEQCISSFRKEPHP